MAGDKECSAGDPINAIVCVTRYALLFLSDVSNRWFNLCSSILQFRKTSNSINCQSGIALLEIPVALSKAYIPLIE